MIFHITNLAKLLNVEQSPGLFYKSNPTMMAKPAVLEKMVLNINNVGLGRWLGR